MRIGVRHGALSPSYLLTYFRYDHLVVLCCLSPHKLSISPPCGVMLPLPSQAFDITTMWYCVAYLLTNCPSDHHVALCCPSPHKLSISPPCGTVLPLSSQISISPPRGTVLPLSPHTFDITTMWYCVASFSISPPCGSVLPPFRYHRHVALCCLPFDITAMWHCVASFSTSPPCGTVLPPFRHHRHAAQCCLCLLYTSPSPRDFCRSRMPSSA